MGMNADELRARVGLPTTSGRVVAKSTHSKPWVQSLKSRARNKPTVLTPRKGGSRVAPAVATAKRAAPTPEAIERARQDRERQQAYDDLQTKQESDLVKAALAVREAEAARLAAETAAWRAVAEDTDRLNIVVDADDVAKAVTEPAPEPEPEPEPDDFAERLAERTRQRASLALQKMGLDSSLARKIAECGWYVYDFGYPHATLAHEANAVALSNDLLDALEESWEITPNSNANYLYLVAKT
jgi:hypothetical protein